MRLWKKIALALLAVSILLGGVVWFQLTEPDRTIAGNPIMHDISSQTNEWEKRVDLTNSVFVANMSRIEFAKVIKRAEFEETKSFRFYHTNQIVSSTELVWSKYQGTLICNIEWAVIAQFDEENNLVSADGVIGERGCL